MNSIRVIVHLFQCWTANRWSFGKLLSSRYNHQYRSAYLCDQYYVNISIGMSCLSSSMFPIVAQCSYSIVLSKVIEIVASQWLIFNSNRSHYILTSLIVAASVLFSLTTDCLGIVLELNVSSCPTIDMIHINSHIRLSKTIQNIVRHAVFASIFLGSTDCIIVGLYFASPVLHQIEIE
jgi:hypothetical protein